MSSGTSYSAAEVSGIIALMLQRKPDLTPDRVKAILRAKPPRISDRMAPIRCSAPVLPMPMEQSLPMLRPWLPPADRTRQHRRALNGNPRHEQYISYADGGIGRVSLASGVQNRHLLCLPPLSPEIQ